jgi:hypothetical protein
MKNSIDIVVELQRILSNEIANSIGSDILKDIKEMTSPRSW